MSEAAADLERRVLKPKMATAESIAGYGGLLAPSGAAKSRESGFYAEAVRMSEPIDFVSQDDTCLALATLNPRPMEVRWMEYHNKHTQTFIPLDDKPFVMVLGRPMVCQRAPTTSASLRYSSSGAVPPDWQWLRAMLLGCWSELGDVVASQYV